MNEDRIEQLHHCIHGENTPFPSLWDVEGYEEDLMKLRKFNFMMTNLPKYAKSQSTKKRVRVTHDAMFDTLEQFGDIVDLHTLGETVYVQFLTDTYAHSTHKQLNGMMIGNNIVKTKSINISS
jgi:hypothetical protein